MYNSKGNSWTKGMIIFFAMTNLLKSLANQEMTYPTHSIGHSAYMHSSGLTEFTRSIRLTAYKAECVMLMRQ